MNKRKIAFYLILADVILNVISLLSLTNFWGRMILTPLATYTVLFSFSSGGFMWIIVMLAVMIMLLIAAVFIRKGGKKAGVAAFIWYVLETALTVYIIISKIFHIFGAYYFKLILNVSILIALFLYLKTKKPVVTTEETR